MKNDTIHKITLTLIGLLFSTISFAQFANVQIIHNAADAAVEEVDIYVNGSIVLNDFAFRNASPFIGMVANFDNNVQIAPANSINAGDAIFSQTLNLADGESYVVVAEGIVSASGYSPSPAFGLEIFPMARQAASVGTNTDVLVHHGSTDAPTVDVVEVGVGAGTIVDDASYTDFAGYLELATADYELAITDMTGQTTVATYAAPLALLGLEGAAITVVASGFLDPSMNSNGPAFGLFAATAVGGPLVPLPPVIAPARLQVIHNSADAAASVVDVYVNDNLLLDDFNFRTASPFVDAPAGVELVIGVAPGNSTSAADAIATFPVTLAENATYIVVADGIVSASGYSPAEPFGLQIYDMGRETATMAMNTDVLVHHGSTDAPTVDVVEVGIGAGTIVDNASYTDFAGYLELATVDYELAITDMSGSITVATYGAPLSTLALDGEAITVVASGFLDPSQNSDGPAFGLYVALAAGGPLVELPFIAPAPEARLQVIHNSADAAAAVVDIYANDDLLLDDFAFRTASPFVTVPAGVEITIGVAPGNSTSASDAIATFPVTLADNSTYIVVADGIVSASGYSPAEPFGLQIYDMGREFASLSDQTDVLVHHGATDAPTVDVVEVGVGAGTIVDDASYTDFAGYLELSTADYELDITDMSGTTVVASYSAPLASLSLEGAAITVVASGFLDPSQNSDGPAFGLWVALASGGPLVELPVITGLNELEAIESGIYPSPTSDMLTIEFAQEFVGQIDIVGIDGSVILSENINSRLKVMDVSDLAKGMYFLMATSDKQKSINRFIKK